jgi:RecA/RadA recombinase
VARTKKAAEVAETKESAADKERRKRGMAVAERFAKFRPARDLAPPIVVPTRFVQFDYATRIGGYPCQRVVLVHGPSGHGKTVFEIGIADSFVELDHFAKLEDAERTTDGKWLRKLAGSNLDKKLFGVQPLFLGNRPDTYEDMIADAREYANGLIALREEKVIPEGTCGFLGVDSMKKLVPKNFLDEVLEEGAKASDVKVQSRLAQHQAAINALWLKEMVPLSDKANLGVLLIAREIENPNATQWEKDSGWDFKIGGGKDLVFDASLRIRVELGGLVTNGKKGKEFEVYGERHKATIAKSKVEGKDKRVTEFYFHTSNGKLVPEGFDRARDVLELAKKLGVVKVGGSSYAHGAKRIGVGENAVVKKLTLDEPEWLAEIERETRAKFAAVPPTEFDPTSGVVAA